MEPQELAELCRPGVAADDLLHEALAREGAQIHLSMSDVRATPTVSTYRRRAKHLARRGLLLADAGRALADMERLEASQEPLRVVVVIEPSDEGRRVYTTLVAGDPPAIRVCFAHLLPGRR